MPRAIHKVYPKFDGSDSSYVFYLGDKRYVMRYSGKPMLLLQGYFEGLGGTDFHNAYEAKRDNIDHPELGLLDKAADHVMFHLKVITNLNAKSKSPFVIYS